MVRESNPRSHLSFDFSILQIWNQHLLTKLNLFEISVCVLLNDPKINKKNICLNVLNRLVSFCYILRIFEKREELGKIDYASYFHVWFIGLDKVGLIYFCFVCGLCKIKWKTFGVFYFYFYFFNISFWISKCIFMYNVIYICKLIASLVWSRDALCISEV